MGRAAPMLSAKTNETTCKWLCDEAEPMRERSRECCSKAMKASRMLSQTGLRWNTILPALVKLHLRGLTQIT
jgi:hypothetical protein